jgi:hypothetical protein
MRITCKNCGEKIFKCSEPYTKIGFAKGEYKGYLHNHGAGGGYWYCYPYMDYHDKFAEPISRKEKLERIMKCE